MTTKNETEKKQSKDKGRDTTQIDTLAQKINKQHGDGSVLRLGGGRAEAREVQADEALHALAHAPGIGRIRRRRENLDIAFLEHHAAVGRAGRLSGDLMHGDGSDGESELFPHRGGGIEVGHEMPEMIEAQLARGRALPIGDIHSRANITA